MAKGTIDQLNFEVILNDTRFDAQIRKDIALANQLNTSLTNALNLRKRLIVEERSLARASAQTATAQQRVQATLERSARSLTAGGGSLTRAWLRFSATLWSVISIIRIFTRTIGSAIKRISEFQQANANLATIMQKSRKEIEVLTNDALMLGRTTEWTASQVTELQTALAKLGYNIPQIRNMQDSVLQFATAVGAKLPDAANLAGAALRMFGMHSTETKKALEILTASTNKTALDFEKLKVALPYVGAIAHTIGFDIADTSAMLGVLANSGLAASRTGTGLRQVLLRLSKENSALQEAMGGNIKTFDDFVKGLELLRDRGLSAGEAQKLVGDRAGAALLILANGVDDIRRLNNEIRDTDGLLKDIQEERLDTLHGSTLLLKSAWEGLIQTFRESAGPMKDIVDWLTKIVRMTSLAASRVNRVAQGTNGSVLWGTRGVVGSDALSKQFKDHYDNLIKNGTTPEEAAKVVEQEMQSWMDGAQGDLIDAMHKGYRETWLTRAVMNTWAGQLVIGRKMNQGREANEQIEAIENAMDATRDYMVNQAQEAGEMAAQAYLEEWKMIFDTQGAAAARAAMKAVVGYENIKSQVEAYIANGGMAGADDRGADEAAEAAKKAAEKEKEREAKRRLKEEAKAADDARKSLERYLETMEEWIEKNQELSGTGTAYNVSKAIGTYRKAISGADRKAREEVENLVYGTTDNFARLIGYAQISEQNAKAKANALVTLRNELTKYADDILKEQLEKGGFDLTDWSDKTLSQINDIKEAINGVVVPDSIKELILGLDPEKGPALLADLTKALEELKKAKIDKTVDPEKFKKIAKQAKYIAERFLSVSNSLKEFADASGNQELSDFASRIGSMSQIAKSAYDGYKMAGTWGAIVGGFTDLVEQALGGMTAMEQRAAELRDAIRDIRLETENQAFQDALLDGANGLFGDNFIKRLKDAVNLLEEVRKNMAALEYVKPEWSILGYKDEEIPDVDRWKAIQEGRYGEMPFITSHSWLLGDESKTLEQLADEFGMKMYDTNGFLNPKLLQAVLDTYGELNEGAKDWMSKSIQYAEQYAEALQKIEEATSSIFDDLASNMADNFIDNFLAMGNAVDDLSDTFADLGDAILRSFLQSYILEEILNKYSEEAKGALSKYAKGEMTPEQYAAWLNGFADNVQKESEALAPAINGMIAAFKDRGLMNVDQETANSVGSGIKSITEETANLLASYINAIRADVSYIRVMQERGWEHINAFGASLPTLNDHIAQIAATNFDLAQSNQSILSELQSVIGAPGTSGMVVRVEAS